MRPVAFIDANIPIYAAGGEHPNKANCTRIMRMVGLHPRSFFTNSEVLQELMHRYRSSGRWTLGKEVFRSFAEAMRGRVEPVFLEDVEWASDLASRYPEMHSRDLVHAAVMKRLGVDRIVSADRGFDRLAGLVRLDPVDVAQWEWLVLDHSN